jgi:hypothetical protein
MKNCRHSVDRANRKTARQQGLLETKDIYPVIEA